MSSSASPPCGPFRCSDEKVIDYARLAIKGKTQKCPVYAEYHAGSLIYTPSIAQHTWVMATLCFALPRNEIPELDIAHCIQLSVVYGMKLVAEELCRNNPAEKLLEELKQCKSLASQIVLEVDKIATLLLTPPEIGTDHFGSIMQYPHQLKEWAKDITHRPPLDQDSVVMTESDSAEWSLHGELLKRVHLQHPGGSKSLPVFARTVAHLLRVKRQGWLNKGIDATEAESVADHSWLMAVLCFLLRDDGDVNIQDAVRGCIVHDLAESLVGDITYRDKIDRREKLRRERDTIDFLQSQLLGNASLKASWEEFETAETPTGRIAKDLDKVDLAFQASDYEERMDVQLPEFFVSAQRATLCGGLIKEIIKKRKIGTSEELDPKTRRELDKYYGN